MKAKFMRTAVLTLDGFKIQEEPIPKLKENDILVKTLACGVCSGDLFVYQNRTDFVDSYNRLGHEASGEVTAVGPNVTNFVPGDLVTALSLPAYSDYFVAQSEELVKLPTGINPTFALGEAIACCVHAANRFGIQSDNRVAIVGCGFMGLICQQLAAHQGAGFICGIDPLPERRELSQKFGAAAVYDPTTVSHQQIVANRGEFDVVIEAAGVQNAVDLCTELVTQHGRIILIGYHQSNNGLRTVNMQQWNFKAIDVVNGHVRRQDEKVAAMQQGMELLQQGHIHTEPLVTIYDFAETEQAFQDLTNGVPNLLKAVLKMGDG
ncbi:zinc-binding dehydrogenase [Candidatus Leptofilum sp.]|uniref:zinc-binding dehydrogenase n=1 Tax=Candidatus Leptofilum sp. TaxID=3241576 RepID=UPI003B5A407D